MFPMVAMVAKIDVGSPRFRPRLPRLFHDHLARALDLDLDGSPTMEDEQEELQVRQ